MINYGSIAKGDDLKYAACGYNHCSLFIIHHSFPCGVRGIVGSAEVKSGWRAADCRPYGVRKRDGRTASGHPYGVRGSKAGDR